MRKIPTLFQRDPDDLSQILPVLHPDTGWVLGAGEAVATRKYDGTCVAWRDRDWWARREVKEGKASPDGFVPVGTDPATGKTVGWEPIEQSGWHRWFTNVEETIGDLPAPGELAEITYELCGPRVNGNPENLNGHWLIRHSAAAQLPEIDRLIDGCTPTAAFERLRSALSHPVQFPYEGIVWHHPDGRMAKLKARDFRKAPR